jgi:hypothetical protein
MKKKKLNKNLEVTVFDTGHEDHHHSWGAVRIVGLTGKGFHIDWNDRPCLSLTEKTAKDLIKILTLAMKKKAKR